MKDYPFFDLRYVVFPYHHITSESKLNRLRKKALLESCKIIVEDKNISFNKATSLRGIVMKYNTWCNNTGDGRYINKQRWKQFHWLYGKFLKTSSIAKNYAIRYPITLSEKEVKKIGLSLLKRHARKYLKNN